MHIMSGHVLQTQLISDRFRLRDTHNQLFICIQKCFDSTNNNHRRSQPSNQIVITIASWACGLPTVHVPVLFPSSVILQKYATQTLLHLIKLKKKHCQWCSNSISQSTADGSRPFTLNTFHFTRPLFTSISFYNGHFSKRLNTFR